MKNFLIEVMNINNQKVNHRLALNGSIQYFHADYFYFIDYIKCTFGHVISSLHH